MPKLVRLKPYDPKKGHVLRRYMIEGKLFDDRRGWYKVPDALAQKLARVPQRDGKFETGPAFDITDEKGALQIERREEMAKAEKEHKPASVAMARDLTTEDLRTPDPIPEKPAMKELTEEDISEMFGGAVEASEVRRTSRRSGRSVSEESDGDGGNDYTSGDDA